MAWYPLYDSEHLAFPEELRGLLQNIEDGNPFCSPI